MKTLEQKVYDVSIVIDVSIDNNEVPNISDLAKVHSLNIVEVKNQLYKSLVKKYNK